MFDLRLARVFASVFVALLAAPRFVAAQASRAPTVGPAHGTVIVVGGGSMGPELYSKFIEAAGGPNALIIDVPTAGGDSVYGQNASGTRGWKAAGAKNIYVFHTKDRKLADTDSFTAILAKAGGIWFEGGRQFHLVDSYAGTKSERGFMEVLNRGGVIGGSSAGASIIGDFLVRGAPSNDNFIMDHPATRKASRICAASESTSTWSPESGFRTWPTPSCRSIPNCSPSRRTRGRRGVVKGDTATIVGRNKAFVYGGKDATDAGKPFLTLYPGDRYNLAARKVMHRAAEESPVSLKFVDSLFSKYASAAGGGATVLVAQDGKVFIDASYGIAAQAKYMPTTTVPQFSLGGITAAFTAICEQVPEPPAPAARGGAGRAGAAGGVAGAAGAAGTAGNGGRGRGGPPQTTFQNCVTRRISTPIGMHKTSATPEGDVLSDVDELYRLDLGLGTRTTFTRDTTSDSGGGALDATRGWQSDNFRGTTRLSAFAKADGKRAAFVRLPEKRAAIIILTNDDGADAKGMAEKIADRLLSPAKGR